MMVLRVQVKTGGEILFIFNKDGRHWVLREKAILLTPDEYRFTTAKGQSSGVPQNLLTKMKICQGQMSNVYPFLRFSQVHFLFFKTISVR